MAQIVGFLVLKGMMRGDEVVLIENPARGKWQVLVGGTKGTSIHDFLLFFAVILYTPTARAHLFFPCGSFSLVDYNPHKCTRF